MGEYVAENFLDLAGPIPGLAILQAIRRQVFGQYLPARSFQVLVRTWQQFYGFWIEHARLPTSP